MKTDFLYGNILDAISSKIPNKRMLAITLAEILNIEMEAVYRRLRGEVAFSFYEIAVISSILGISLDDMMGTGYSLYRPFRLRLIDYADSMEIDYKMLEQNIYIHNLGKDDKTSKIMDCSSVLSPSLYLGYKAISRFFLFKWIYQSRDAEEKIRYNDVYPTERLKKIQERSVNTAKLINQTFYIWDPLIFNYLVNDIRYFISINLLAKDDLLLLKKDLLHFLNDMEMLAAKGRFDDTGNSIYFYISSMNLDTSYCCIEVKHLRISLIRAFTLNAAVSLDYKTYEQISGWLLAILKSSTLISVSGSWQRTTFFGKQRKIINAL